MQTYKKRSDIPVGYTWNLSSIFATDEDWERDFQTIQKRIPELEALKGTVAKSGQALLTVLQTRDEIYEPLRKAVCLFYPCARTKIPTNGTYLGLADRAMQLFVRISTAAAFIEPEILALSPETLDQYIQQTPEL